MSILSFLDMISSRLFVHAGYEVFPVKGLCESRREPFTQPGGGGPRANAYPAAALVSQGIQRQKVVDGALEPHCCDAHPNPPQLIGHRPYPLVRAEHEGLSHDDERRRKSLRLHNARSY